MSGLPIWSVMIPTYNSAQYLAETLGSVLRQGYPEELMEIVVVDNCSTDTTKSIVEEVGKGRIKWIQNATNIGMMNNFNECVKQARGLLLHILNSDDLVKDGFYKVFQHKFDENPLIGLISCDIELINEQSSRIGIGPEILSLQVPSKDVSEFFYSNPFRTPGVVVKREAYNRVGNFDINLTHCADWDMWVRVIKEFGAIHIKDELCKYRYHTNNATSSSFLVGEDILDTERVFKKFEKKDYGIDKKKYFSYLKNLSLERYKYLYFSNKGNANSLASIKQVYLKYHSSTSALMLEVYLRSILFIKMLKNSHFK